MDFSYSSKTKDYLARLDAFMREYIEPYEDQYQKENYRLNSTPNWREWQVPPRVAELKQLAKEQGLWNLFLPDD